MAKSFWARFVRNRPAVFGLAVRLAEQVLFQHGEKVGDDEPYFLLRPVAACLLVACLGLWWRGTARAAQAVAVFDKIAGHLGLTRRDAQGPDNEAPRRDRRGLMSRTLRTLNRMVRGTKG